MDVRRFDNLILALPQRAGSRRTLTAFMAGLGMLLLPTPGADTKSGKRKRKNRRQKRKKNKATDSGIEYFELLTTTLQQVSGDCDALAQAAAAFQQQHAAELDAIRSREQAWDAETRSREASRLQERITQATETLHTLMTACRFRGAAEAAICVASGSTPGRDQSPLPGAAQCSGCDCSCICPISVGDCVLSFFGCLGGTEASCCWFGACAGHMCTEQCPNCCNCGVSCCGC